MKKRVLCTLLIAAMCFGETLSVAATTVSVNEVQETTEETQAGEEVQPEEGEELAAEQQPMDPYIELRDGIAKFDRVCYQGNADSFKKYFTVTPGTTYVFQLCDETGKEIAKFGPMTCSTADAGSDYATVEYAIPSTLTPGHYKLKYGIDGKELTSISIYIKKSIDAAINKNISVKVVNAVYTGVTAVPEVIITETIDDAVTTLRSGIDFEATVTSANKKNLGTAALTIKGLPETSDFAGTITASFDIVPAAPAITSVTSVGFKSAKITWNKSAAAEGYYIDRRTEKGTFVNIGKVSGADTLSYTDTTAGIVPGETYYYRVQAYAASTTAAADKPEEVISVANEVGAAVKIVPNTPKLTSLVSTSYNKLKLTWEAVEGAQGYEVYRIESNGTLTKVKTTAKTAYTISKNITCGKTYNFTVKAYTVLDDSVTKVYSEYDHAGLRAKAKPATPTLVSAASTAYNKVTIKWKKVSKAYGYYIYRKEAGNPDSSWKRIKKVKLGDTTQAVDTKAETGVKYIYTVKAYTKVNGKAVFSDADQTGKTATAVPAQPTIELEQVGRCVNVKIKKVAGADGYIIYRKQDNGKNKRIATVSANKSASITTYADTKVSYAKNYTYYVKPYTIGEGSRVNGKNSKKVSITTK